MDYAITLGKNPTKVEFKAAWTAFNKKDNPVRPPNFVQLVEAQTCHQLRNSRSIPLCVLSVSRRNL